jgi:hypothetical protein
LELSTGNDDALADNPSGAIVGDTVHIIFRVLGGQGPLLNAWKAICYGMAPTICLGFLPVVGLLTGIYATLLQLSIGPATLYRLRDGRAYILLVVVLSIAITFFYEFRRY